MKSTSWFEKYFRLFLLNRRVFIERLRLDVPLIGIGLLYIFLGRSQLDLTVGKGVFFLVGFVYAAVMESQIIKRNTGSLSFYMKLPIHRKVTLALFYLSIILPNLVLFTILYLLLRAAVSTADIAWQSSLMVQRYFQVIFAFLFIKSLTINLMIAMSIHYALIVGYFLFLGGVLLFLSILSELIAPLFVMTNFTFALVFLLSTYLISFVGVKRIGL